MDVGTLVFLKFRPALANIEMVPSMTPIIDVHSHLGQFTNSAMSADGETLSRVSREAGITHVVTFSIEACYGTLDRGNRYTVDEVNRQSMLSAMVVAHPNHMASSAAWIR